jgi:two component regulator with propeller domain
MIEQVYTYSDGIQCVHAATGGLWLGHQGGVSYFNPESGMVAKWTTAQGLPAQPVLHIASAGSRLALATPNGIAWTENADQLVQEASDGGGGRWQRGLAHARGIGVYVNGIEFVGGRIHAATGGGRVYLEKNGGFQLLELPLRQARLLRLLALASPPGTLRLLLISNNGGILLLATGEGLEPSLYQWSEEEGLCSRYVTALGLAGDSVAVGVHGCIHVARQRDLVQEPEALSRWGRIVLPGFEGPTEHSRVHALAAHGDFLYAGTSAGLYRVPLAELELAAADRVTAHRLDDGPVRHLVSFGGELWGVQHIGFGRFLEGSATPLRRPAERSREAERVNAEAAPGWSGHRSRPAAMMPRITSFGQRWRFLPEPRWHGSSAEPNSQQIFCLASTPDGLAWGGENGHIGVLHGSRWSTESLARQRRSPEVHALVHDPESGRLWAATRLGLFHRDSRGRWQRDLTFPGRTVHQLLVWRGSLIALGSTGLHAHVQSAWSEVGLGEPRPPLFAAAPGEPGLALAARPGAGFYIWKPGTPKPAALPVQVGRANCMAWDEDGRLWVGTDHGLACWNGRETESFQWGSEPEDHVTALLVHAGRLYVGSHAGVWIAPVEGGASPTGPDLAGQGTRVGLLEGMPTLHVSGLIAHAGRVWIGTHGGLALLADEV